MPTLRERFTGASRSWQITVIAAGLVLFAILVFVGISLFNNWQENRTEKTLQRNAQTVATGQKDLDTEVQRREVETVRHESTITVRSEAGAIRVEAVPVGRQLEPVLDQLCGMHYYPDSPECAGRVQRTGDGEEAVRGGGITEK